MGSYIDPRVHFLHLQLRYSLPTNVCLVEYFNDEINYKDLKFVKSDRKEKKLLEYIDRSM